MTSIRKVFEKKIDRKSSEILYAKDYVSIIAVKERMEGNSTTGTVWFETTTFHKNTPVKEIIEWAKDTDGKLIITIDESTIYKKETKY